MITKVATHLLDLSSAIGLESEGLFAGAVPLLLSRTTSTPRTNVGCAKKEIISMIWKVRFVICGSEENV